MKTYKKIITAILGLTLVLSMTACEDPSVAGNKPAGDHSQEDERVIPSSTPAPREREIDEGADPLVLDGITIYKYKNCKYSDYSVADLGGGIHSDIHEITIVDAAGNELMPFPADKPFRDYARNLLDDEMYAFLDTPRRHNSSSGGIHYDEENMISMVGFYNVPGDELSLLDRKYDSVISVTGKGTALPIISERLGTPTSVVVTWNSINALHPQVSRLSYVWICDGFYVVGDVILDEIYQGDYHTLSFMDFYLCSGDPNRDYEHTAYARTKAELGLS